MASTIRPESACAVAFARPTEEDRDRARKFLAVNGTMTHGDPQSESVVASLIRNLRVETERLHTLINTPETSDFLEGVKREAAHQRERWGTEHDGGKAPADWFWLLGYLSGKALAAHIAGNTEKALHHTISSAAALANWHAAILGKTNMRPGIEPPNDAPRTSQAGENT